MQESYTMEKKPVIRPNQPQAKGGITDFKRNQDAAGNRLGSRGGRSVTSPNTKLLHSKSRSNGFDKKPRHRGSSGSQVGGNADIGQEKKEHELGSVNKHGSKKQNLNHLLNFHYAPRESAFAVNRGHLNRFHHHKYNKEQYLQANCQFIVRSGEDYSMCMKNPDALVNWDMIEQILVKSEEPPRCPICLDGPLVGRITRCGHIYCYPCLLHYLALSDKTWRKCPICFEAVYVKDVKSVSWIPMKSFSIGDTICLQLMRRPRQSLQAVPVGMNWIPSESSPAMLCQSPDIIQYCKLLQADPEKVSDILNSEISDLLSAFEAERSTPEACFIEQALFQLKQIKISAPNKITITSSESLDVESIVLNKDDNVQDKANDSLQNNEPSVLYDTLKNRASSTSFIDKHDSATTYDTGDKDFYFYQASDGQPIYLAGLNAKILERSYGGSLSSCPTTITGVVEAKEIIFVSHDLRKRLRYLQHLPVTCQIELVELKLIPPTVNIEALEYYHDQLVARHKARQRKTREEKRRDFRITRDQQRQLGIMPYEPSPNLNLQSISHFPLCGRNEVASSSISDSEYEQSTLPSEGLEQNQPLPRTFAKILVSSHAKPEWPTLRQPFQIESPMPSMSYSSSKAIIHPPDVKGTSNSDSDLDGYAVAPNYTQSFSDAISQALENISIDGSSNELGRKKKKKQKHKILFATGMNFHA